MERQAPNVAVELQILPRSWRVMDIDERIVHQAHGAPRSNLRIAACHAGFAANGLLRWDDANAVITCFWCVIGKRGGVEHWRIAGRGPYGP